MYQYNKISEKTVYKDEIGMEIQEWFDKTRRPKNIEIKYLKDDRRVNLILTQIEEDVTY